MLRLNLLAFMFMVIAGINGLTLKTIITAQTIKDNQLAAGLTLLIIDLGYRLQADSSTKRAALFSQEDGGFIAFFPVWILGIILIILAFLPPELLN